MKAKANKHAQERKALTKAVIFFLILSSACALLLIWAAKSEDSKVAQKIRNTIGIQEPSPKHVPISVKEVPPTPAVTKPEPISKPKPAAAPEPLPTPSITYREIAKSATLWPKTIALKKSKRVPIRYQDKTYGYMEFIEGTEVEVVALKEPSEIYCLINNNPLSLSVNETNFVEWFTEKYADRYELEAIVPDNLNAEETVPKLGTPEGEADYLTQMRLWCHRNYGSISLEIGEDTLIFKWLPKEDAPINYQMEAREIAHKYLLLRAELGGIENYAACEIRDPTSNELMGASSIFIPRL